MPNKKHEYFGKKKSRLASMGPSGKLEQKEAALFAQVLCLNMVQHWEDALDRRTVVPLAPGDIPLIS